MFIRTLKRYMGLLKCIQSFQLLFCMHARIYVCTCDMHACLYWDTNGNAFSFFGKNRFNCYDFPSFNDYLLLKSVMWHMCVPACLLVLNCSMKYIHYFFLFTVLFSVTILTTQATCQQRNICVTIGQCGVVHNTFSREKLIICYVFIARGTAIIFILTWQ